MVDDLQVAAPLSETDRKLLRTAGRSTVLAELRELGFLRLSHLEIWKRLFVDDLVTDGLAYVDRDIAYVRETGRVTEPGGGNGIEPTAKRKPGKKKASYMTEQREAKLAADWKRARQAGIAKVDFARKTAGMPLKEFNRLLNTVAHREARVQKDRADN